MEDTALVNAIGENLDAGKKRKRPDSTFHFVLNTNISNLELKHQPRSYRMGLVQSLKAAVTEFRDNIGEYIRNEKPGLMIKDFTANIEIGTQKKFLHLDGMIYFEGYCLIDTTAVVNMFNEYLNDYSNGVYFQVKYVHDNVAAAAAYSAKDQARIL